MPLAFMRLFQPDHPEAKEYRVTEDGKIETRILESKYGRSKNKDWSELSSAEVSRHVMRNTAVGRWLEQNLGWQRLLWACVGEHSHMQQSDAMFNTSPMGLR
jgi:hypothetical protein